MRPTGTAPATAAPHTNKSFTRMLEAINPKLGVGWMTGKGRGLLLLHY